MEYPHARAVNIDEFLYFPVVSGFWAQRELWDGTYTLDDLLDIHEMLAVKLENERRAADFAKGVGLG
jgi:hypothetical protein